MNEDIVEEVVEEAPPEPSVDYETAAREEGWVPEDEWKGEPPAHGFLSAEEFYDRGEQIRPILRANNKRMKEELSQTRSEIEALKQTAQDYQKFADAAIEREKKETQRLITELEDKKAEAISNADGEAVVGIDKQIKELEKEPEEPTFEEIVNQNPEVKRWFDDNSWYSQDSLKQGAADGVMRKMRDEGDTTVGVAFLNAAHERLKQEAPGLFPEASNSVEPARRSPTVRKKGKTFNNLPDDAKREFEGFKKMMPDFTEEKYLEQYEWE